MYEVYEWLPQGVQWVHVSQPLNLWRLASLLFSRRLFLCHVMNGKSKRTSFFNILNYIPGRNETATYNLQRKQWVKKAEKKRRKTMGKNVDLLSTYSLESFFWQRINAQIFLLLLLLRSLSLYNLFSHFELGYGNNYSCRRLAVHHGDGQALVARSLRFNEALELGRLWHLLAMPLL